MKRFFLISLFIGLLYPPLLAQVSINKTGAPADSSAILDVQSTDQGFLPPRMYEVEKAGIDNPAEGLMIYNYSNKALEIYNGITWVSFSQKGISYDLTSEQLAFGTLWEERGTAILARNDGKIILAGRTNKYLTNGYDAHILRLNSDFSVDSSFNGFGRQSIGGSSGDEEAWDIIETSDGRMVMAGYTSSFGGGGSDGYIWEFNDDGSLNTDFGSLGTRTVGGYYDEYCYDMETVLGGGFILCGIQYISATNFQGYMHKLTPDGRMVMAGYTSSFGGGGSDGYIWEFNDDGSLNTDFGSLGTRTVGGYYDEYCYDMETVLGGGFILCGIQYISATNFQGYMHKLTPDGDRDWDFSSQGKLWIGGDQNDYLMAVEETSDYGYIACGYTNSFGAGGYDMYLFKVRPDGTPDSSFGVNSTVTFGGNEDDFAIDVKETANGGLLAVGATYSYGAGYTDLYIVKFTSSGALDASFGTNGSVTAGGSGRETGRTILLNNDGTFLVGGYTNSYGNGGYDMYVVKFTSAGIPDSSFGVNGFLTVVGSGDEYLFDMCEEPCGTYLLAWSTTSFGSGGEDMYLVRINRAGQSCGNTGSGGAVTGFGGSINSGGAVGNYGGQGAGGTLGGGGYIINVCSGQ